MIEEYKGKWLGRFDGYDCYLTQSEGNIEWILSFHIGGKLAGAIFVKLIDRHLADEHLTRFHKAYREAMVAAERLLLLA